MRSPAPGLAASAHDNAFGIALLDQVAPIAHRAHHLTGTPVPAPIA
ncbi:hypothetical protein [Streptomyces sp. NPDC006463]